MTNSQIALALGLAVFLAGSMTWAALSNYALVRELRETDINPDMTSDTDAVIQQSLDKHRLAVKSMDLSSKPGDSSAKMWR